MDYLPIFLDIRGRKVLVDGGGTVAARRVERALDAGAEVIAFDPNPGEEIAFLESRDDFVLHHRLPQEADVEGCAVVYGATEDPDRDAPLLRWSKAHQALCNIADDPDNCDFITPSIVDRSPMIVAISTSGAAPVIARIFRARIETALPAAFGRLATFASGFRNRIAEALSDSRDRRHFWERMIDGPAGDFFLSGNQSAAEKQIDADLDAARNGDFASIGEVYMVGAGPGDPDLLTFRALRLMQRADVVLYDRLVSKGALDLVRRDAERIFVGKQPQNHVMSQEDIVALMIKLAKEGNRVLRLKGGDPYVFGRGGEEIEGLTAAGVNFQVVPGINAASGCSTYAGIPLTHRDHAQSCVFVTAHGKDGVLDLDWDVLIRDGQTVAVFMGLSTLGVLTEEFRKRGADMNTLVAVVQNGTRPDQKVVTGSLRTIAVQVEQAGLKSPAIILIGNVVSLHNKLYWQDRDQTAARMSLTSSETPNIG